MNTDSDLFVQAFWVKCREVIRPEIDAKIAGFRQAGHDANVSTQEFSPADDGLPEPVGPALRLSLHESGASEGVGVPTIEFHADVERQIVDVIANNVRAGSYELAALGAAEVRAEIDRWTASGPGVAPVPRNVV